MFIIKCSRELKVQEILNYLSTKNNIGSNNNRHVKKVRKKVQHREENLSAVNAQKKASDENDQKRYHAMPRRKVAWNEGEERKSQSSKTERSRNEE